VHHLLSAFITKTLTNMGKTSTNQNVHDKATLLVSRIWSTNYA
jgi:hypothetical protein